jgi:hypothetical protein
MLEQRAMSRRGFRLLLIANWALTLVAVFAHFTSQRAMPTELQGWLQAYQHDLQRQASSVRVLLVLLYVVVQLAVTIGLFTFKRWAKSLLLPITVLGYLLVGVSTIIVDREWVVSLKSALSMVYGMIIALVYFSPLGKEFGRRSAD